MNNVTNNMDLISNNLSSSDSSKQLESLFHFLEYLSKDKVVVQDINHFNIFPTVIPLLNSSNDRVREQSALVLGHLASISIVHRNLLLDEQVIHVFLNQLGHGLSSQDPSIVREAAHLLRLFFQSKPRYPDQTTYRLIPAFFKLLYSEDLQILTDACVSLSCIARENDYPSSPPVKIELLVKSGVCKRCMELIGHTSVAVKKAAMIILDEVACANSSYQQQFIDTGLLTILFDLISTSAGDEEISEAVWLINNLAADDPRCTQAVIDQGFLPIIIQKLPSFGDKSRRRSVWIFSTIAGSGTPQQLNRAISEGCIEALCNLLDDKVDKVLRSVLDTLEALLQAGQHNSESEENYLATQVTEANGEEKLEALLSHPDQEIKSKAKNILQNYFNCFSEESNPPETTNNAFVFGTPASGPVAGLFQFPF